MSAEESEMVDFVIVIQLFKKKLSLSIVNEPKGTLSIVIMNDNAPAKVVTVWPWHYMINLHS